MKTLRQGLKVIQLYDTDMRVIKLSPVVTLFSGMIQP